LPAEVWVAGPPPRSALRRLASPNVRYLGPDTDVARCYQAADWFVHPTRYDACANTVLQAMACGLPGVISRADGAHELVRDRTSGFLLDDPGSAAQLRALLEEALALGPAARRAWGEAARAAVLPLTWETHLDRWADLAQALVRSPASTSPGRSR
jgi:glycosyltransferase involved in cell wall biosynthesis